MQIKVNNTKIHTYPSKKPYQVGVPLTCSVAEGKLVLVPNQPMKRGDVDSPVSDLTPIIISETEKIEEDNWIYDRDTQQIQKATALQARVMNSPGTTPENRWYFKILALPEHFSPQQLQMVADGKLMNDDKVLVECYHFDSNTVDDIIIPPILGYYIKSPLSFYPVEEKVYTRGQLEKIMAEFMEQMFEQNWSYNNYQQLRYKITSWLNENTK